MTVELEGFGPAARRAVTAAEAEARALGTSRLGTEHLLLGVLAGGAGGAAVILREAGLSLAAARRKVGETNIGSSAAPEGPGRSARAERAMNRAFRFAHDQRSALVRSEHLLLGVLDVEGTAGQVLRGLGIDVDQVRARLLAADPTSVEPDEVSVVVDEPTPPSAIAPSCATCRATLSEVLTSSSMQAGDRAAVVFSCGACGTVLGVSPA